jgi:competence protein ComEC
LSTQARNAFRQLGLSHLLAVSGLHLALVASMVFAAVRLSAGRSAWLAARWDTRSAALLVGVLVSILYALYAGWGTPVRRALILLLALAVTVTRSRTGLRAEPIAAAAMMVLAFEPGALFEAGAQLSFVAAGALVFAAPRPERPDRGWLGARVDTLEVAIRSSATVVAATAPISAWQFGAIAPIGLLANLIAIPWTAFVVLPSAMLAGLATGCGFESLARVWVPGAARVAAATLEFALESASHLPPPVMTARPPMYWLCGVGLTLAMTLCVKRTLLRLSGAVLVSGLLAWAPVARIEPPPPRLIALEVGQGSASIIQGREAAVLVDAGGGRRTGDWGQWAVLPALAALGIDRLDLVVVSHGDLDHRGGVPSVLRAIEVGEVWVPFGAVDDPDFDPVWQAAHERGVVVRERGAGEASISLGDIRITPLWPPARAKGGEPMQGIDSRNDRSLVVGVEVGGARVLLPGDLEAGGEQALIRGGENLRADVLVLSHHGSRSSSSATFLQAVGAPVAIASAPCGGHFGMPHQEVLDRAKSHGISTWWTGRDGAVMVALRNPLAVWGYSRGSASNHCRLEPSTSEPKSGRPTRRGERGWIPR